MNYDFDTIIDRSGTKSIKWELNHPAFNAEGMLPLWIADMDFACPPAVTEALQKRVAHPLYGYSFLPSDFYGAVREWIARRFSVTVDESWMTGIAGVIPGMHVVIDAFTEPQDKVLVQPPVYNPFFEAVEHRGRQLVENPLVEQQGRYEIDWDDFAEKVRDPQVKLFILCSPHNPVGRAWSREELLRMGELCLENRVLVVADEIHADLVYEKGSHTPYYSLPPELAENSLILLSASKTFNLAGFFTSILMTPNRAHLQTFKKTARMMGHEFVNLLGVEATIAAYRHGEPWLEQLLPYLHDNAKYIHHFLATRIPQVSMPVPEATYLGWIDFRRLGMSDAELATLLRQKARLGLHDGKTFGKQGAGFYRINFACPRAILVEAMERLERALQES
ncbi:MalY/PatB family protein [Brevibacillus sp. TJ4]|uniref:MalY/PatB family protein n=1 Tax=Brevibacillus sp. TJ4 TaxID=3234853 RepID=UPI0037D204B9